MIFHQKAIEIQIMKKYTSLVYEYLWVEKGIPHQTYYYPKRKNDKD